MDGAKLRDQLATLLSNKWTPSTLIGAVLAVAVVRYSRSSSKLRDRSDESFEPGLFKKHSSLERFTTPSGHVYPEIRTFYQAHPHADKLPNDIPLLVFMHGLGGNATQFNPLLISLVNVGPCLAIDLPGCGMSSFKPDDQSAYSTGAFAELLFSAIERYRQNNQKVVLIGHSMGASICSLLASSTSPLSHLISKDVSGFVSLCPRSEPPSHHERVTIERLKWMPTPVFDFLRMIDRRGGLQSKSISRVVGEGADEETRKLQVKHNQQSKSATFLRMIIAALPATNDEAAKTHIGWPGKEIWSGIKVPLFLVAGESDVLTPPTEIERIAGWLSHNGSEEDDNNDHPSSSIPDTAGDADVALHQVTKDNAIGKTISHESGLALKEEHTDSKHTFALKTTIFPAPAAHGLIYDTSTVRILAGLVGTFISGHADERLSAGWQLQHLASNNKWDVKNLTKWKSLLPLTEPIGGLFRASKTLREVDDEHSPKEFAKRYSSSVLPDGVAMFVDITHDTPVFDPKGLEDAGIEYHKLPIVSKIQPSPEEVEKFIRVIDQLRASPKIQATQTIDGNEIHPTIAVSCQYARNRTGFLITCYLVERLGYKLQVALEEFAAKKPPGIKHQHFINELYVRYAVKMERRRTITS